MRKGTITAVIVFYLMIGCLAMPQHVHAGVEWTVTKQVNLDAEPLDVASSPDGKLIFVLVPGEVLIYTHSKNKITDQIPVDKVFNRLRYTARTNTLVLTSSSARTLKIIELEWIYSISVSGLPFRGPVDAPVTVAVFSDYQ
jgi:hypothetical protein